MRINTKTFKGVLPTDCKAKSVYVTHTSPSYFVWKEGTKWFYGTHQSLIPSKDEEGNDISFTSKKNALEALASNPTLKEVTSFLTNDEIRDRNNTTVDQASGSDIEYWNKYVRDYFKDVINPFIKEKWGVTLKLDRQLELKWHGNFKRSCFFHKRNGGTIRITPSAARRVDRTLHDGTKVYTFGEYKAIQKNPNTCSIFSTKFSTVLKGVMLHETAHFLQHEKKAAPDGPGTSHGRVFKDLYEILRVEILKAEVDAEIKKIEDIESREVSVAAEASN